MLGAGGGGGGGGVMGSREVGVHMKSATYAARALSPNLDRLSPCRPDRERELERDRERLAELDPLCLRFLSELQRLLGDLSTWQPTSAQWP